MVASGILPHQARQQIPQQSQCTFTPVITLHWALVADSTPPRENMGHFWHLAPMARSSDTMTNSLPATSIVVCRGTRSSPKQKPSLIKADCSQILPARTLQRGSYWPLLATRHEPRGKNMKVCMSLAKYPRDTIQNCRVHQNRCSFWTETQWKATLLLMPYNPARTSHHKWTQQSLPDVCSNLVLACT